MRIHAAAIIAVFLASSFTAAAQDRGRVRDSIEERRAAFERARQSAAQQAARSSSGSISGRSSSGTSKKSAVKPATGAMLAVDVYIVQSEGAEGQDTSPLDFQGTGEDVRKQLNELEKAEKIKVLDRLKLSTVEDVQTMVQVGKQTSVVRGGGFGGGRGGVVSREQVGTLANLTARADGDRVVMNLQVEKSFVSPGDDDDQTAASTHQMTVQSTVSVKSGDALVVGGQTFKQGKTVRHMTVIVAPRIATARKEVALTQIFTLQHAEVAGAGAVLKELYPAGQLKFSVDVRTNSLIVHGEEKQLQEVEAILLKLDEKPTSTIRTVPLEKSGEE